MDLFELWRIEERYAKAGYRIENVQIGIELNQLVPYINQFDYLKTPNGVYQLEVKGVTAFLVKTESAIRVGTYNDHVCSGGKKIIDEFIKRKTTQ